MKATKFYSAQKQEASESHVYEESRFFVLCLGKQIFSTGVGTVFESMKASVRKYGPYRRPVGVGSSDWSYRRGTPGPGRSLNKCREDGSFNLHEIVRDENWNCSRRLFVLLGWHASNEPLTTLSPLDRHYETRAKDKERRPRNSGRGLCVPRRRGGGRALTNYEEDSRRGYIRT